MGMVRSFSIVFILILSFLRKNMLPSFFVQKSMTAHSKAINYAGSSSVQRSNLDHYMAFIHAESMQSVLSWREGASHSRSYRSTIFMIRRSIMLPFPPCLQQRASLRTSASSYLMANNSKIKAEILLLQWFSRDPSKRGEGITFLPEASQMGVPRNWPWGG